MQVTGSDGTLTCACILDDPVVTLTASGQITGGNCLHNAGTAAHPGANGDPHIRTWTGMKYDYHGECDLVMCTFPDFDDGRGLTTHIRTTRQEWFSYIEAVAFKTGDLIVNIDKEGLWLHENLVTEFPLEEGRLQVNRKFWNKSGNGTTYDISIGHFKKMMTIKVPPHNFLAVSFASGIRSMKFRKNFAVSGGLMGDFATGKTVGRDGLLEFADMNEFGQEWQVQPYEDMLFLYPREPQLPDTKCLMPSKKSEEARRTLRSDQVKNMKAEEACAGVAPADYDDCVTDTLATGFYDLADGY